MNNRNKPTLIDFLECPECSSDLLENENSLKCTNCDAKYEISNGIPLMYHKSMDFDHLKEEENLARMMRRNRLSRKEQLNVVEWEKSKYEFWAMVRDKVEKPPKSFINIGCGYDKFFRAFENEGHFFINFDMVYDILDNLQTDHRAKSCVAGDYNRLPFKKLSFDYVVSIDAIHHEYNRLEEILISITSLLKPGGTLFLEDPNAWGLFQLSKSIMLPTSVHQYLRSTYHKLKKSTKKPADYEFATNVWKVKDLLKDLGFVNITIHPNNAYPNIGPASAKIYTLMSKSQWVRKYHNYHYMISAVKKQD